MEIKAQRGKVPRLRPHSRFEVGRGHSVRSHAAHAVPGKVAVTSDLMEHPAV